MAVEHNDEKLEAYLRQFRPQQPQMLPQPSALRRPGRIAVLTAAVILIGIAAWLTLTRRQHPMPQEAFRSQPSDLVRQTSLASLSRIVREDPEKLDVQLDSLAPRLLPDVQRSRGVLKSLARE